MCMRMRVRTSSGEKNTHRHHTTVHLFFSTRHPHLLDLSLSHRLRHTDTQTHRHTHPLFHPHRSIFSFGLLWAWLVLRTGGVVFTFHDGGGQVLDTTASALCALIDALKVLVKGGKHVMGMAGDIAELADKAGHALHTRSLQIISASWGQGLSAQHCGLHSVLNNRHLSPLVS